MHREVLPVFAGAAAMVLASVAGAQSFSVERAATQPARSAARPAVSKPVAIDTKPGVEAPAFILTILHHNDGESQLLGLASDPDFGRIDRFKSVVDQLRAAATVDPGDGVPRGVVVIGSGDNYLPGPEFNASLANGIPFYDTIALDRIGYDALILGNHEFDFGPEVLAQFIAGFTMPPPVLSANLDVSTDPFLAPFASNPVAADTVIDFGGQRVAIIGATTPDLPFISSPGLVTVNTDVVGAVQARIDALSTMGVDKIIVASHLQGIGQDEAFIAQIDGADIVVAGGGSSLLANPADVLVPGDVATGPYPTAFPDLTMDPIPTVTTVGDYAYVGRLVVAFNAKGEVISAEGGPVRVSGVGDDAVEGDASLFTDVVEPVAAAIAALGENVIATSSVDLDGRRSMVRSRETNVGNLTADSQLWEARRRASDFGAPMADIALQNGGGLRNDAVIPAGDFTELDTFDIAPFANNLGVVSGVTPERLKEVLENCYSRIEFGDGRFGQISGLSVVVDLNNTPQIIDAETGEITQPGSRVVSAVLDNGRPIVFNGVVVPGPDLSIATSDFLAGGGDQYPLGDLPFTFVGVTYQRALFNFVTERLGGSINAINATAGGEGRIQIIEAAE